MNLDSGFDDPDFAPPMCLCCEATPAICYDTDLGPVCGDCSYHLGLAIGQLVQTPGIAAHASPESNR